MFVYADPGHETAAGLRSWGRAHRELWDALRERGLPGRRIRREIDRIEQAICGMDESVIQAHGSLQGHLARITKLRAALPTGPRKR